MFYVVIVLQFLLYTLFCTVTIHKIIKNIITFLSHIIFLCLFNAFYFFYYYRKYIMLVLPCTTSFIMYGMHPTKMADLRLCPPQKSFFSDPCSQDHVQPCSIRVAKCPSIMVLFFISAAKNHLKLLQQDLTLHLNKHPIFK